MASLTSLLLFAIAGLSSAFYLPGVAPRDFAEGEPVDIKVDVLESPNGDLSYKYYSLGFCEPEKLEKAAENLGEILGGERIENSPFEIYMLQQETCKILCKRDYTAKELKRMAKRIVGEYRANWILDNIPVATRYYLQARKGEKGDISREGMELDEFASKGFAIGYVDEHTKEAYVNNHYRLFISYHQDPASFEGSRIVGFDVEATSIEHQVKGEWKGASTKLSTCAGGQPQRVRPQAPKKSDKNKKKQGSEAESTIIWTYDVRWVESEVKWASRWDIYLRSPIVDVHWYTLTTSAMMVLALTSFVATILIRTLNKDLREYNSIDKEEEEEESGWKLIHADVFRPPARGSLFAILVGSGVQLFVMAVVVLVFAVFGFLSPSNRGGLMTAALLCFVSMGIFAGYFSTRVYKMFGLPNWKTNTFYTALLVPGAVFTLFFVLNLLVWHEGSSGAVPFGTLVAVLVLWFGISVPLVYLGSFVGFKRDVPEQPVRVSNIPRAIPPPADCSQSLLLHCAISGWLPFMAIFVEVMSTTSHITSHQFDYVFGFLSLVFIILVLATAETAIVLCYRQLCCEDYNWWWRAFLGSATTGVYMFGVVVYKFGTQLIGEPIPFMVFFGYAGMICMLIGIMCGTIGYFACYFFIRKIYASIKID